jgi:hypothetical protein
MEVITVVELGKRIRRDQGTQYLHEAVFICSDCGRTHSAVSLVFLPQSMFFGGIDDTKKITGRHCVYCNCKSSDWPEKGLKIIGRKGEHDFFKLASKDETQQLYKKLAQIYLKTHRRH